MYCTSCGTKNSDTAKFCRGCGRPMGGQGAGGEQQAMMDRPPEGETVSGSYADFYGLGQENQAGGQTDPYGVWSQGSQAAGRTDPYGGWNPGGQASQPYGGGQSPYGQGYAQPGPAQKPRKKKKGIIIAVVLIVLAALIGAGVYIAVKSSSPMAPVDQFFDGFLDGDWEKVYDSIYWGEEGDDGYMSKSEFLSEVSGEGSDMLSAVGGFVDIKISKVSEGEAYVGDDGLTRKNITIELSAEVMGMSQTEEIDMAVVKSSKKFLFIPAWKIDNQAMGAMF